MDLKQKIKSLASECHADVIQIRNHIHSNPELSFQEFETSKYIKGQLDQLGVYYEDGFVKTGIVATIEGKDPSSKTIAMRADIDALPILEENDVSYKSKNDGVMHACGHDVHTSIALGMARILQEVKEEFTGTVKLIFQPGEEKLPGGASLMIEEGILDKINAAAIFGIHVMPTIDAGQVGFRSGIYMASADEIYLTIKGKGGHAALPDLNIDPLRMTAEILVELYKIKAPSEDIPMVLAFGKMNANGATNVIPAEVTVEGTFRTMNEEWRMELHALVTKIAQDIARSHGGECDVLIKKGYPCLVNDENMTASAKASAEEFLGEENVGELDLRMTADDFATFSQAIPGCYFRLGIRNEEKGINSGVHTPTFNIDEKALETGVGLMTWLVVQALEK
ncbi:MAG: amidohydrolase [Flavobacteriales bacterium]|nr:amidohydrolase [Flavobacteriales bacterium]